MEIYIPMWVFWSILVVVCCVVLFLAFFGAVFLNSLRKEKRGGIFW